MFAQMLTALDAVQESLQDAPEARIDTEALVRVELANVLARGAVLLRALAADEEGRS
jgi:hypothetical protein